MSMLPSCKFLLVVAGLAVLGGCQSLKPVQRFPGFTWAPTAMRYAQRFGCDTAEMRREATENKNTPVAIGESTCVALGRFGEPVSESGGATQNSEFVIHTWVLGKRDYSVVSDKYVTNSLNIASGFPVGRWVVSSTLYR